MCVELHRTDAPTRSKHKHVRACGCARDCACMPTMAPLLAFGWGMKRIPRSPAPPDDGAGLLSSRESRPGRSSTRRHWQPHEWKPGARAVHAHAVADAWWGMGEVGKGARLDVDKALVLARNLQRPQDEWCAHALTAFPTRACACDLALARANTQQRHDGVGKCIGRMGQRSTRCSCERGGPSPGAGVARGRRSCDVKERLMIVTVSFGAISHSPAGPTDPALGCCSRTQ